MEWTSWPQEHSLPFLEERSVPVLEPKQDDYSTKTTLDRQNEDGTVTLSPSRTTNSSPNLDHIKACKFRYLQDRGMVVSPRVGAELSTWKSEASDADAPGAGVHLWEASYQPTKEEESPEIPYRWFPRSGTTKNGRLVAVEVEDGRKRQKRWAYNLQEGESPETPYRWFPSSGTMKNGRLVTVEVEKGRKRQKRWASNLRPDSDNESTKLLFRNIAVKPPPVNEERHPLRRSINSLESGLMLMIPCSRLTLFLWLGLFRKSKRRTI